MTAAAVNATTLLRPGLLEGSSLLLAGPPGPLADAVGEAFGGLGARVSNCLPEGEDEAAIDAAVLAVLGEAGAIDMLVVDGAGLFDHGASNALRACLDAAWNVTRAVVNHAFLPHEQDPQDPPTPQSTTPARRIVYLAPAPDAGEHALAARAALENLARTLSVEWARHGINTIAIAPGPATPPAELAALAAFLASPAGAYFTGCLLDLGGGG